VTGSRWVELDGAVNVRDLGGLPTVDGRWTRFGRVLRSDNLQELTAVDVEYLVTTVGVRDVIDLRSAVEVAVTGPGPLAAVAGITVRQLSLFAEPRGGGGALTDVSRALPWHTSGGRQHPPEDAVIGRYLDYLAERPESIVAAVKHIAYATGATMVACAAGKDRTGVVCALVLDAIGVTRAAVVADYTQTGERIDAILDRLRRDDLYAADVRARPASAAMPKADFMQRLLAIVDERHGGARGWLRRHGWTTADQDALATRLVGDRP
jgi:protein tyrosine/serine phosphatase